MTMGKRYEVDELLEETERETKFFFISYDTDIVEIPINKIGEKLEEDQQFDNWFFAQMYASIRCAFMTYGLRVPKYAYIDRSYRHSGRMQIVLVRDDVKDEEEALRWMKNWYFVQDELKRQAYANSDETGNFVFEFKVI